MAKAITFGLICFVLIGIFYGVNHTTEIDEATRNLEEAKRELDMLDGAIKNQENLTAWRKELWALSQVSGILQKKNDDVRSEIRAMERSEARVMDSFLKTVERVRNDTIGMTMDELPLANGLVLKRVRVQGLDRTTMSVLHSEGISKVALEDLPDDLKARLRIGMTTLGSSSLASNDSRSDSSASDRMAELGRYGADKVEKKATSESRSDSKAEGDPALWDSVTRRSLGRAFVPGQGWLEVGAKGPIPGSGR